MLEKLKNSVWPWPLLFFACLFPFSAVYLLHFPDERHYVDAAIRMLDTGEYWLPQTAEGLPRFKKPLLAYWLTTASFGLFGIYEFAARLPFLLTACLILWLTWRMTFYLFADKTKASLASAILLCHIPFVMAAMRSMPDILSCLGILMAAYGIARTMFWEERGWHAYFILYGGLLITLQSKGLLGFVLIGYAWIYALTIRSRAWLQHAWRHLSGLIVVSTLVCAWFWWVEQQYADAVPTFLNDQVTEKIETAPVKILTRFFGYILNFLGLFSLPWLVAIVYAKGRHTFAKSPPNEEGVMHLRRFIFGWFLLCVLLFSFGKLYTIRYLLPVSPLFSIVLADALSRTDSIRLTACYGLFISLLSLLFCGLGWCSLFCAPNWSSRLTP